MVECAKIFAKWFWFGVVVCAMAGFAHSAQAASHVPAGDTPPTPKILESPGVSAPDKITDPGKPIPTSEPIPNGSGHSHDEAPANADLIPENKSKPVVKSESSEPESYPEIQRDLSKLPFPVRRMRELILEATQSGDIEKLRPLIGFGDDVTMLSLGGIDEDPIAFLKTLSGDPDGHELLAILSEVMEMGYVVVDEGTEHELYVWPYFFAWPLDRLSNSQKVELFRLVTWGDFEEMQAFGAYIFYRAGITPRGRWRFFVAGD